VSHQQFEWHKDEAINYMSWDKQHQLKKIGRGTDYRKITAIFQLTDPDTYEGCDLEFEHGPMPDIRKRGTLIIFPSFVTHRVTKLISGMRRSYTVWYHGDIWK
jgi:predicted 2-oxoglutarate/Fe(II)-dependent dioxygenase YbiX